MKARNLFKTIRNVSLNNASLDVLQDASGNSFNTAVATAVNSGIADLAANVASDDIAMASMQSQISSNATSVSNLNTTVSNLNTNIVSVSQRTATLEGKATATDASITRLDSSLNLLNSGKANLSGANTFSGGLNVFTNGSNTAAQIVNLACSGNNTFSGGDKATVINTGSIAIGASSGTTTNIYNANLKGNTTIYDNPITYDTLVSITNNKQLTHKKYVDDAITAESNNLLGRSNVFTQPQAYDPSLNNTTTNPYGFAPCNYVSSSIASSKDITYSFFSSHVFVGGATTTLTKINDTNYLVQYPYTGTNNTTSNNVNQNFTVKQKYLNLPTQFANNVSVICRSATIRVRMELEFGLGKSGYTDIPTTGPDPHGATFSTEQFFANFNAPTGTNGHCYIEGTICLALSGGGAETYFNAHSLSGTALINNNTATVSGWTHAPQSVKWKNNSTNITWTPFNFVCLSDSKIRISVNVPSRLNNIGVNYWTVGYRYRVEILDSLPMLESSSDVYSGTGMTNSNMRSYCGGAYFTDS